MSFLENNQSGVELLFKSDKIMFLKEKQQPSKQLLTIAIVMYEEDIQHELKKIIQRINQKNTTTDFQFLMYPWSISTQTFDKNKMLVFPFKLNMISTWYLDERKEYRFSDMEILEAAASGLRSLKQLHSLNVIHGNINPMTTYFFDKEDQMSNKFKKTLTKKKTTLFGVNILNIQSLYIKPKIQYSFEEIYKEMFKSRNQILNLKNSYKDDVESLLYVLFNMSVGKKIFDPERFTTETKKDALKQWKIQKVYVQLLKSLPTDLIFLMEIYLQVQDLGTESQFDFQSAIKKINKFKEGLAVKQKKTEKIIHQPTLQLQKKATEPKSLDFDEDEMGEVTEIDEDQIKLMIRPQITGTGNIFNNE